MVLVTSKWWRPASTATLAIAITLGLLVAGCSAGPGPDPSANPPSSITPSPDYPTLCAPVGADSSSTCLRLTLEAVDHARSAEGLGPMRLPADFPDLTVPQQLLVAVDRERVDRGLAPFAGLSEALDQEAQRAADADRLPARPASGALAVAAEWIGGVDNGLDAVYEWMYDDGPGSGTPNCSRRERSGCWDDRHALLKHLGSGDLVMGAGFNPVGAGIPGARGGSSLAATLAVEPRSAALAYTWAGAVAATATGTLSPLGDVPSDEALTGIPDPRGNVAAKPDFTRSCASSGFDDSPGCVVGGPRRHQPRARPGGSAAHGAPVRIRTDEHARPAPRRRRSRAGGPRAATVPWTDRGAQPQREARRRKCRRPARRRTALRAGRLGVGRRVGERPRRRLRLDVRRRLQQRQSRLRTSR